MVFPNGAITRIEVTDIENVTTPDLDGATFKAVIFIADELQPIWPGTPLPVATDFAAVEDITLVNNAARYAIAHP